MKNRKKLSLILAVAALIACLTLLFWDDLGLGLSSSKNQLKYKDFYNYVSDGSIESVVIKEKILEVKFSENADIEGVLQPNGNSSIYTVENPNSPTLKEYLLMKGVSVKEEISGDKILSNVLDIIFYLIFFGAIFILAKRVIAPNSFKVVRKTGKSFKDIVGMESLKKEMTQVMDIMHNPKEWEKKGLRMPKGVLLEGAPGNGKTLFAKALAGEASVNFIPTKATDFESMLMAIGPMKVKMLFRKARRMAPCIIFIDEFDGIGTRRNYSGSAIETENTRIVTALLNELDGFSETDGVLVLAATNSIQALDEALIRPGRFDTRVTVPYPDDKARYELIEMYTSKKVLDSSVDKVALVEMFKGYSCAKIESVLNEAGLQANQRGADAISIEDIKIAVNKGV